MLSPPFRKIAIVGAGAVGGYYGAQLARAGRPATCVHFLLRAEFAAVREHGWRVLSPAGDFAVSPVHAHRTTREIGACDLVIIAAKATANDALAGVLTPLLHERTALFTLQNGLGNEEFFAARFGAERVLGGKCFVCLSRIESGVIRHMGHGVITLGEFGRPADERTRAVAALFQDAGIPVEISDNIAEVLWRKLTWNIPFNGLAIAAGGRDVAQILADEKLLAEARALMREVIAIARAGGVLIEDEYIEFQIARTRPMGDYQPSSLLDWQAGREVEVEAIWGAALQRATQLGVPAPHLQALLQQLRTRASAARTRNGER